jgi:hypothetical protein
VEVEAGSKPAVEGVMRAFRFCVMLSSMEPREIRRKSVRELEISYSCKRLVQTDLAVQPLRSRIEVSVSEEEMLLS